MVRPARNSRISGRARSPLLHEHLDARRRGQVAELVVRAFREQQVHLLERVQHGEGVGDDRRVVVLLVEGDAGGEQIVERLEELRAAVGARSAGTALP